MKNLTIVGCTHGDEQIGKYIFDIFAQGQNDSWNYKTLIGNPEAMFLNTRFVETDLNRSFDKQNPTSLEEKRAVLLTKELHKADFVVDIHQTTAVMEHCAFIISDILENWELASYFNVKHVILANGFGGKNKNLLLENTKFGVAIEYSRTGNYQKECQIVQKDIQNLIDKKIVYEQKKYKIIGKLDQKPSKELVNWQVLDSKMLTELGLKGEIYPIFIGEKAYGTQYCTLVSLL